MKLATIAIATVLVFATLTASARLITSTRLDPKTVNGQKRFAFKIEATKETNTVRFSVTVEPNEAAPSSSLAACLMLFDGVGEITCQPLAPLDRRHRAARYEFEVNSNYLAHSQFVFKDLGQSSADERRLADSFWFFLRDFAHEK